MSQYFLFKNTKQFFFSNSYPEVVPLLLMVWLMLLVGLQFWLLEVRAECC